MSDILVSLILSLWWWTITGEVCRAKMWNLTCENKNSIAIYYFVADWQCVRLVSLSVFELFSFACLPCQYVRWSISTYHDDLLRKLAERYQAPLGNHNYYINLPWMAGIFVTHFCALHFTWRQGSVPFHPSPQPKGANFAPDCMTTTTVRSDWFCVGYVLNTIFNILIN